MIVRVMVLFGAVTLSASAQAPTLQKPAALGELCQQIANAAFEANRRLTSSSTFEERSAPFVSKWLVQRALAPDAGGVLRTIGRREECSAPPERCRYLGAYETVDNQEMDIPGVVYTSPPDSPEDYGGWYKSIGMFPARGEFLDVKALSDFGSASRVGPTGAFLKAAFDRQGLACAFDNRLHESYSTSSGNGETPQSCAALLSDDSVILEPDKALPAGLSPETFRAQRNLPYAAGVSGPYDGSGTFIPTGIVRADVDGDGTEEMLVRVDWAGQGDRCTRSYYDVLDSNDPSKLSSAPVRALVWGTQGTMDGGRVGGSCNTESRIRRKGDRILFEYSGLDPVEKRGVPVVTKVGGPLERTLREVTGGQVRYLCSTQFAVEPMVRYAR